MSLHHNFAYNGYYEKGRKISSFQVKPFKLYLGRVYLTKSYLLQVNVLTERNGNKKRKTYLLTFLMQNFVNANYFVQFES